jgi:predicted nucleic acid-binding protein
VARVFLDANVFLYALGGDSPQRQPCRAVIDAIAGGDLDAVTSTEVLQEILHVRRRRADLANAIHAARTAAAVVTEVLSVTGEDLVSACTTLERHPHMSVRDAVHVAVMNVARVHTLISTDTDFDAVREIKRIDPKDAV